MLLSLENDPTSRVHHKEKLAAQLKIVSIFHNGMFSVYKDPLSCCLSSDPIICSITFCIKIKIIAFH